MSVTRYYNPSTGEWELVGVGVRGPAGPPGGQGPEGDPGPAGTQIFYTTQPPSVANLGDMWIDRNGFRPNERVHQDVLSERPNAEAEIEGMLFWATDEEQMYYCDGSTWQEVVDSSAYQPAGDYPTSQDIDEIVVITESAYEALNPKDERVFYIITEDPV